MKHTRLTGRRVIDKYVSVLYLNSVLLLQNRQTAFHQRNGALFDLAACYRLRATNTTKFSEPDWLDDHIACPGHNRLQLGDHSLQLVPVLHPLLEALAAPAQEDAKLAQKEASCAL